MNSTWDLIKRTGQVRMGIFEYPPYFMRDKSNGEWVGAMVDMGKDIANELKVKFVPVEVGGFGEAVLSLQAGKVDMNFALQATPSARHRHRLRRTDLLDRMGDGEQPELQGPGLG